MVTLVLAGLVTLIVIVNVWLSICTLGLALLYGTRVKGTSRRDILGYLKESLDEGVASLWIDLPIQKRVHLLHWKNTSSPNQKALLCIPGTGSYSICYLNLMRSLETYSDVYVLDLPGWGISDSPELDLRDAMLESIHQYYAQVIAEVYCHVLRRQSKCEILAHSLGAYLMVHCMTRHKHVLGNTRVTLMSTPGLTSRMSGFDWFWSGLITYSIPEKLLKKWGGLWHWVRWLYSESDPLTWFNAVALLNPEGEGYEVLARHMKGREWSPLVLEELVYVATTTQITITMIWGNIDTLVDIKNEEAGETLDRLEKAGIHNVFMYDAGHCLVTGHYADVARILDGE